MKAPGCTGWPSSSVPSHSSGAGPALRLLLVDQSTHVLGEPVPDVHAQPAGPVGNGGRDPHRQPAGHRRVVGEQSEPARSGWLGGGERTEA